MNRSRPSYGDGAVMEQEQYTETWLQVGLHRHTQDLLDAIRCTIATEKKMKQINATHRFIVHVVNPSGGSVTQSGLNHSFWRIVCNAV